MIRRDYHHRGNHLAYSCRETGDAPNLARGGGHGVARRRAFQSCSDVPEYCCRAISNLDLANCVKDLARDRNAMCDSACGSGQNEIGKRWRNLALSLLGECLDIYGISNGDPFWSDASDMTFAFEERGRGWKEGPRERLQWESLAGLADCSFIESLNDYKWSRSSPRYDLMLRQSVCKSCALRVQTRELRIAPSRERKRERKRKRDRRSDSLYDSLETNSEY
jgi:hypothetical protein